MSEDEAALVAAVAGGDETAFRQLLARHGAAISRFTRRMLANADDADDLAQEVFLRLWTEAHRYRPEAARLSTWLHRIAHNLCVDWRRKHARVIAAGDALPEDGDAADPAAAMAGEARARRVRESVAALPARQRDALLLTHYQGLANRDVAAILGVSVDALESLLARARRQLRAAMEESDG